MLQNRERQDVALFARGEIFLEGSQERCAKFLAILRAVQFGAYILHKTREDLHGVGAGRRTFGS